MSVKLMSSDTIRADLQALALTWPDGIPPEQVDRVNALRGELKRRGEDPNVTASIPTAAVLTAQLPIGQMRQDDLEKELRDLSDRLGKKPDDEAAQNRFADVRFELRRRAKSNPSTDAPATPPPPPTPRALELPPEDAPIMDADATKRFDVAEKKIRDAITAQRTERIMFDETKLEDAGDLVNVKTMKKVGSSPQRYGDSDKFSSPGKVDPAAVEELARRTAEGDRITFDEFAARATEIGTKLPTKLHTKKAISPTGGWSATAVNVAGFPKVAIEFERKMTFGFVCVARQLTIAEAKAHVAQVQAAIADAEASNRLSDTIVDVSDDDE